MTMINDQNNNIMNIIIIKAVELTH